MMSVIKAVIFDMFETLITHYDSPLYFGEQMAADIGISNDKFQELWEPSGQDRTIGKITLEDMLEIIFIKNNCYSENMLNYVVQKRIRAKEEMFEHLHREIIPLLDALKKKRILIGLISNCFSEEAMVIKKSILYPYFDVSCLSYDEGLQKPDVAIFYRCLNQLNVQARECLYVGDGGDFELEAAEKLGMKAVQAVWYFKEDVAWTSKIKSGFKQIETPSDILQII